MTVLKKSLPKVGAAIAVSVSLIATPVSAQFGRLLPRDSRNVINDATSNTDNCGNEKKSSVGSRVLGGILGRSSRRAARDVGISTYVPMSEVSGELTKSIACKLEPEEQLQAADATLRATRSLDIREEGDEESAEGEGDVIPPPPPIGSTASWTSESRDDVSGSSTVVGRDEANDTGLECITVTDVIIVSGEETTANKRMCRAPGSRRYALAA